MDLERASDAALKGLFNHVALPAQLPQKSDSDADVRGIESALVERLLRASKTLRDVQDDICWQVWEQIHQSLLVCKTLNIGGKLDKDQLALHLGQLQVSGLVILHVAYQNAGIAIYKTVDSERDGSVDIELFEASPKREDVLSSQTLSWDFPGTAVQLPSSVFEDGDFLDSFSAFLEQASKESTQQSSEYVTKAGKRIVESRDSPNPALITSFLTALLEANGKRISPTLLQKRVRDDVCWFNSETPWRRLPYWLVLRVAISRFLAMRLGGSNGRIQYKFLMCIMHAAVLDDIYHVVSLEDQDFLKRKLCRRLFKLDRDHSEQPPSTQTSYDVLIKALTPRFNQTIRATSARIEIAWNNERRATTKFIPPLPQKASPRDQRLSLVLSREYLMEAKLRFYRSRQYTPSTRWAPQPQKKHVQDFGRTLFSLFEEEDRIRKDLGSSTLRHVDSSARCAQLRDTIVHYIDQVKSSYDNNPEQKSIMLLIIMEAWVALDKEACAQFPLLYAFHPVFTPRMLEVLQLFLLSDISRVRKIEAYLQDRIERCDGTQATIFDDPCKGCFAERYFNESTDSDALTNLLEDIESIAAEERIAKEKQWRESSTKYETLTRQIDSMTCLYVQAIDGSYFSFHDDHNCQKCHLEQQRSCLKIRIFESPLPESPTMAKAVVFELQCPRALAAYRDTTWRILWDLASDTRESGIEPRVCLHDYSELRDHDSSSSGSVTLASTAKSFLMTHWAIKRFPVELDQVCLPNALRYGYYDQFSKSWPGRKKMRPSFAHHCRLLLPKTSPFAPLLGTQSFAADGNGPTSYEIAASLSTCPQGISTHEYMSFQSLLAGKGRRWITILTELGSSNLNFSTETAVLLLNHLAPQCGPRSSDHLGIVHCVFRDASFCKVLLQQLTRKLEDISSNWRETHLMEIIIMLSLRLVTFTMSLEDMSLWTRAALGLLSRAREISSRWMRMLREETHKAKDIKTSQNCQSYLLWAALLCKRTYAAYLATSQEIDEHQLAIFCECSITIFDNIPDDVPTLGHIKMRSFIRDLRMMYDLKVQIHQSIERHGKEAFLAVLNRLWPASESKHIDSMSFRADYGLQLKLDDSYEGGTSTVDYNYMHGILLIDGQLLGRLPSDPQSALILKELFGSETSLMKYPSGSPGMTHVLNINKHGYHTHIGYDNGRTIIRAISGSRVLELIPRETFYSRGRQSDLPAALITDCIHWLDVKSGVLEIRPKSKNFWKSHPLNWKLELSTSVCFRHTHNGSKETLVDPYSPLFARVARIFGDFEYPAHLTIYQPERHSLVVDMPRMQLRWFVNANQMLRSNHLRAEIDPCQCIDTWHGLDSKIVCKSFKDPLDRFVLVPLGETKIVKRGCHVRVTIESAWKNLAVPYLSYMVNNTLGRIDCATEPILVYKKAELHAVTSFILPDPLTGLTGTESALSLLSSGVSQPWAPLSAWSIEILDSILKLSPKREYYPEDRKIMKKEAWDSNFPTTIQREEYRFLVGRITSQSERLAAFYPQESAPLPSRPLSRDSHLDLRALHRRQTHQRSGYLGLEVKTPDDTTYEARDNPGIDSLKYSNTFETAKLVREKPRFMAIVKDLAMNLSQSILIKGYTQVLDKSTLSNRLDMDIRQEWGPLVSTVKEQRNQYSLQFFLGVISFRSDANMPLIRTLIAFSQWDRLRDLDLPIFAEYCSFRPRQSPQLDVLVKLMEPFQTPPPEDPPLVEFASGKDRKKLSQARKLHIQNATTDCTRLAQFLLKQWPSSLEPSFKDLSGSFLVDIPAVLEKIRPEWQRFYYNHQFHLHLDAVQAVLDERHSVATFTRPDFVPSEATFSTHQSHYGLPNLRNDLMRYSVPKATGSSIQFKRENREGRAWPAKFPARKNEMNQAYRELECIISSFLKSRSAIQKRYAADLQKSLAVFKTQSPEAGTLVKQPSARSMMVLSDESLIVHLQNEVSHAFAKIQSALEQASHSFSGRQVDWLIRGSLWPAVTRVTVLEQLRSAARCQFGSGTKEAIIEFGLAITEFQRQTRIAAYQRLNEASRLEEEQDNVGHRNWRVDEYPDWLLLEIESNLLIREKQVEVAMAIIAPESGASSVLQLNMGQGKTSCIIPMVAILLADGNNLVRISIPKALLHQTAQLLHGRLGGLIGREICHVPFSRRTPTHEDQIKQFRRIHADIRKKRGVMLCLPEHQMSFMLSGLQRVLDKRIPEATMMVNVQKWLNSCARDVLDECDHTLAVRTQLIYPSGSQMAVDGHPTRWLVIEQLLSLVEMHLDDLMLSFPYSIEVVRRPQGGFPFVFFLRPDVEEELIHRLKNEVCRGTRGIIPIDSLEQADRLAVKEFLSGSRVRPSSLDRISRLCPDRPHVKQAIYLLRGLFIHRILIMTLKKRYGVQYGIHPSRDPVAVPFHAKGVPSEQSEFGHVDVSILLTCLATYYGGITLPQSRQALESVLKSDDPAPEYDKWTEGEDFPDYLKDWHSINVDDDHQMTQIWNCVRYKIPVVDYYLNNFVFPLHAKQFRNKLQSNGWDIPLFSSSKPDQSAKNGLLNRGRGLTTGFSGTNDIKPLLPLTIKQDDLPSLASTNAEVLTYLLQPRSRKYEVIIDFNYQTRLTEIGFLELLRRHNIRVLIDAGAFILEMSNVDLARQWLKIDGRAAVALYFEGDRPYIISKQGTRTPLLASPYADNLREVLVYLDEAHTRGTDLKFEPHARAALTLGLGQTKDHTVQAAMRLRQLGTTQSVTFFAPPEVNQSIRDLCRKKDDDTNTDSSDVIRWLINNTCDGIEQLQPLYYAQGIDFCNRMQAAVDYPDFLIDDEQRTAYIQAIRQTERQTLQQLYGPQTKVKTPPGPRSNAKIAEFSRELEARKKSFRDTGQAVHASALQEVEQEREIEYEVENVRQVKKPPSYTPHTFPGLHRDLGIFARTGRVPAGSDVFIPVFTALARTGLGKKYKVNRDVGSTQLFITTEFERTVKFVTELNNDNYMRPVHWILYSSAPEMAVIVTPEEAECLLPIMRKLSVAEQYLLTYAAPVTRRMMHFSKMRYHAIPPLPRDWLAPQWLTTELGFFAGRLYFEWNEYGSICRLLGIDESTPMLEEAASSEGDTTDQWTSNTEASSQTTSDDQDDDKVLVNTRARVQFSGLTPKPYTFTQEYLSVRRRGLDFSHTPMGFLASGKPLNEHNQFFRHKETLWRAKSLAPIAPTQMDGADEEDGGNEMDLGDYDPSAALKGDEIHEKIVYDESEMFRGGKKLRHKDDDDESEIYDDSGSSD
ncbi:hypothetical protein F5X99DRAFT_189010 [Biscogniauxia marginata]|nr:hypothetical protein F5X99DRAFT_189010 [Biscogniauxia marginata]